MKRHDILNVFKPGEILCVRDVCLRLGVDPEDQSPERQAVRRFLRRLVIDGHLVSHPTSNGVSTLYERLEC